MAMTVRIVTAVAVALLLSGAATAQTLSLEGKIKQPQRVTLDDLKKMPAEHIVVSYETDRGPVTSQVTGVLLWQLIETAGGIDDTGKGMELRHSIRITARDGWVVVTSTGEIAPNFGGKAALVIYERDGKMLDDIRMVMPGDKHGGRNARDVVSIKIE